MRTNHRGRILRSKKRRIKRRGQRLIKIGGFGARQAYRMAYREKM